MCRFFLSSKVKIASLALAALLLGVVFAAFSHNSSSFFTSVVSTLFSPLQKAAFSISRHADSFTVSFKSSSSYLEQIELLEKQLNESTQKLSEYENLKAKVKDYENILGLKKRNNDFAFAYATVISRNAADAGSSFVVDVGRIDDVSVNDPVVCDGNIVGIIKKVNTTTSVALSVLDPRLSIGAYDVSTGEKGFLSGSTKLISDGLVRLSGLKSTTAVVSGGIVVTSGAGGVFPPGIVIGTVVTVENDEADTSSYATVKPACDAVNLSGVFVLTDFAGQGEKDDFTVD